ncbi:MAG: porin [Hyphomicrobiales bacterium]|nr:MAG: porin [Hyphomicrobiales bacterium]
MDIKTVLLGSAAVLIAVSGARAADAVVMVEPEPAEYVRVCDVYGAGFFYIPGTETCLKVGGYVRMRFQGNDHENNSDLDNADDTRFGTRVRARLDFDAREETELGTLRAKVRVQATNTGAGFNTGDANYGMDEAYIQLGGLTIGYLDTVWTSNDGGFSDGLLLEEADWAAGDSQQNRISYTFASNGFSATLSAEDDGTGDFVPDVLGKLAYKGSFGGIYLIGVYDEESASGRYTGFDGRRLGYTALDGVAFGNITANDYDGSDSAFALKAGIQLENLFAEKSILKIEGHYAFDPTEYAVVDDVFRAEIGGNTSGLRDIPSQFQIGAAYSQKFGKVTAALNGVYGQTFDLDVTYPRVAFVDLDGADYYGVGANLSYDITKNFQVLGEVNYRDVDLPAGIDDFDETQGLIQFKRTF